MGQGQAVELLTHLPAQPEVQLLGKAHHEVGLQGVKPPGAQVEEQEHKDLPSPLPPGDHKGLPPAPGPAGCSPTAGPQSPRCNRGRRWPRPCSRPPTGPPPAAAGAGPGQCAQSRLRVAQGRSGTAVSKAPVKQGNRPLPPPGSSSVPPSALPLLSLGIGQSPGRPGRSPEPPHGGGRPPPPPPPWSGRVGGGGGPPAGGGEAGARPPLPPPWRRARRRAASV